MKNTNNLNDKNKKKPITQSRQNERVQSIETNIISTWIWAGLAIVIITTFAIYFKAIKFNILYSWDDHLYIRDNAHIKELNWKNIKLFFTTFYVGNYQPITMLFYALEYKIGATKPSIFHFDNILLHLINTYLVFVLIRKISPKNDVVALITAAFFAVHPMHIESVAWISERKDVLYSFFFLLSLIMYINYLKLEKIKYLIYTGIFFALSCLSKSAAVILPLILLLFDYYMNRKTDWKMLAEKIPFFLISFFFGIVAIYSQKDASALQSMAPNMSLVEHVSIVSLSFVSYLVKAFIPVKLSAIYPYPAELGSALPAIYYIAIACILPIFIFVWYSRKWSKDIVFGFVFFIITIILVLQFIPVGSATMADRYTYIPYIGLFFILGKIYERLSQQVDAKINYRQYALILLSIGFITFSAITNARVKIWKNEGALFSDVINKYPNSFTAHRGRALYYFYYHVNYTSNINRADDLKKANADFEKTLNLAQVPKDKKQAYYDLGMIKAALGNFVGAIQDYTNAIAIDTSYGTAYNNRGTCYLSYFVKTVYINDSVQQKIYLKKAITDFNNALKCQLSVEDQAKAYCNRGDAKVRLGDFEGAISDFDRGIQVDRNIAGGFAYSYRAFAKDHLKRYKEAIEDYNKAIELDPQDTNSIKNRDIIKMILENSK